MTAEPRKVSIIGRIGAKREAESSAGVIGGDNDPRQSIPSGVGGDYIVEFAKLHEESGFDRILVGCGRSAPTLRSLYWLSERRLSFIQLQGGGENEVDGEKGSLTYFRPTTIPITTNPMVTTRGTVHATILTHLDRSFTLALNAPSERITSPKVIP